MAIQLTPELERLVNEKVAEGSYSSPEAVLEAALAALEANEAETERLRALIAEGIADIEAGRYETFESAQDLSRLFARMPHRAREDSDA